MNTEKPPGEAICVIDNASNSERTSAGLFDFPPTIYSFGNLNSTAQNPPVTARLTIHKALVQS